MLDQYRTLLKESNAISSRTAYVMDDESAVAFRLMPELALLVKKPRHEWVSQDETYLYRHMKSLEEEQKMMESLHWQQGIRQMQFEKPPVFKLLWADSGNSVASILMESRGLLLMKKHTKDTARQSLIQKSATCGTKSCLRQYSRSYDAAHNLNSPHQWRVLRTRHANQSTGSANGE